MVQLRSILHVADNTGAQTMMVIGFPGKGAKKRGVVGDIARCVVMKASPVGMVKEHEKVLAVLIRMRKERKRKDGSYIRFDDNAGVILEDINEGKPKGTRIFGPVAREVKEMGFNKIASMAKEVF